MIPADLIGIFIFALRFFAPFTILRWPLAGAIFCIFCDAIDAVFLQDIGAGFASRIDYPYFDKPFDTWYLFFEFLVVMKWKDKLARNTGSILFGLRLVGFLAFIFLGLRWAFVLAPNIFEYFFLAMLIIWKYKPRFKLDYKKLTIILLIVGIPNIIKEYLMHYKYPEQTHFFREYVFRMG